MWILDGKDRSFFFWCWDLVESELCFFICFRVIRSFFVFLVFLFVFIGCGDLDSGIFGYCFV